MTDGGLTVAAVGQAVQEAGEEVERVGVEAAGGGPQVGLGHGRPCGLQVQFGNLQLRPGVADLQSEIRPSK